MKRQRRLPATAAARRIYEGAAMNCFDEYRAKLCTAEEAVKLVKSGDWVDYSSNACFPASLDAALALRRDEL